MNLIIAVLFAITVMLAFIEDYMKEIHKIFILAFYAIFMVALATTKDVDHTADAANYEEIFLNNDSPIVELATEPTYIYLSRIVLAMGGTIGTMFLIYALISIPAKLLALYKMSYPYIFTALIIYIPIYFEVQDLIQIRAAAAATFLFFSIFTIVKKQYVKTALLLICATLFHYSALCYLPFLIIGNRKLNRTARMIVAGLLPLCFGIYFLKLDFFSFLPSSIFGKLDFYKETSELGGWDEIEPPYLNVYFLAKCVVLYLCLYYYDTVTEKIPSAPILINLFASSMLFLLVMATIPVIAGRISDIYGIVDCIVMTFCLYLITPAHYVRIAITIAGLYMLLHNMLFTEYFT